MSILFDAPEQQAKTSLRASDQPAAKALLGTSAWMIILVLLSLLVMTAFVAYLGWTYADGVEVSTAGYVAMALGVSCGEIRRRRPRAEMSRPRASR